MGTFRETNLETHTARMLDFEDLGIFEIWLRFGDCLKTSHPRMKDIEDLRMYEFFFEF